MRKAVIGRRSLAASAATPSPFSYRTPSRYCATASPCVAACSPTGSCRAARSALCCHQLCPQWLNAQPTGQRLRARSRRCSCHHICAGTGCAGTGYRACSHLLPPPARAAVCHGLRGCGGHLLEPIARLRRTPPRAEPFEQHPRKQELRLRVPLRTTGPRGSQHVACGALRGVVPCGTARDFLTCRPSSGAEQMLHGRWWVGHSVVEWSECLACSRD